MNKQPLNVLISDEDSILTSAVKDNLKETFESDINISVFNNAKQCLEKLSRNTHLVILAYDNKKRQGSENGNELLKFIKRTHPLTEVLIHSSNDDMKGVLKSFKANTANHIESKNNRSFRARTYASKTFAEPIQKATIRFGAYKHANVLLIGLMIAGSIMWLVLHRSF
jgi:DNA-binding NtrC family response regulator